MLITSLAGGGAERVASELSLNLDSQIQRQIVILTNEVSYASNKPPISLDFNFRSPKILSILWAFLFGTLKYRKLMVEHKPEISMSFLTLDNFINILANLRNKRIKTILQVHIALSMKFRDSILDEIAKHLITILYNRADLIIAVSEGVKQELIHEFKINPEIVKVIYNPNDIEKIKILADQPVNDEWFNGDIPIIFNLGRLTEQKGQWHLIRAFSKTREVVSCKLVIRGNGNLKPYLEKLVLNLDLSSDVKFLDWQDNPYKYLSKASIFVSSSLWEALPYSIIEAMACGCPIIASDCKYGPREILSDGKFGILTSPLDGIMYSALDPLTPQEIELSNMMVDIIRNRELRLRYSRTGIVRSNDFNLNISTEAYSSVFESIANRDRSL
jgi:glycosyltransferase involved in cell wall biosynthesis